MSLKKRLVKTPPGTEYIEATMIPRTVGIGLKCKPDHNINRH